MRFGKELFQKKSSGEPNFSSQVALDYFAKIYNDEERDCTFTPLPEMKRPPAPTFLLSEEPPSQGEIMSALRLNATAPHLGQMESPTSRTRNVQHSGPSCTGFFPKSGLHVMFPRVGLVPPSFFFQNPKKHPTLLNFAPLL